MRELGVEVSVPPLELCTDNAAMIASAARWVEPVPFPGYLALDAYATARPRTGVSGALVLYGRPGCHLCDDARDVLLRGRRAVQPRSTSSPTTRCTPAYLERIPVVTLDGEELFELLRGRKDPASSPERTGRPRRVTER